MTKTKKIRCSFFEKNEVNINPDGQVYPCCFFANTLYITKQFGYPSAGDIPLHNIDPTSIQNGLQNSESIAIGVIDSNPIYKEYVKNEADYNLDNKSIKEILDSDWFSDLEKARETWETAPQVCKNWCTVK